MLPEFLAYRYEGITRPDQILLNAEGIGWKCRKYIRWKQVHHTPGDGKILKDFADDLFEKGEVNLSLYGQVNSILLNVQKWRLDKDHLSIDPPSKESWEYVKTLLQVVSSSPQVIAQWLSEKSIKIIKIAKSTVEIQMIFYLHLLDQFFSRQQTPVYSPVSESNPFHNGTKLIHIVRQQFGCIYESVGLEFPVNLTPPELVKRIYGDFGFDVVFVQTGLETDGLSDNVVKGQAFINYKTLESAKLFKVNSMHGNFFLDLNDEHPFIQEVLKDNKAKDLFEVFFKCYVRSLMEMTSLSDTILTFSSYLENHLRQEFSSTKK